MTYVPFTEQDIRDWCGGTSFERGRMYYQAGRVSNVTYHIDEGVYTALVIGEARYRVKIEVDTDDDVDAYCDCPVQNYCKHVAAVMLHLINKRSVTIAEGAMEEISLSSSATAGIPSRDLQLSQAIVDLFKGTGTGLLVNDEESSIEEQRSPVQIEFLCHIVYGSYTGTKIAMEMKFGEKRTYVVQKIGDFLSKLEQQISIPMSKSFTYNPQSHRIEQSDLAVLRLLCDIRRSEKATGRGPYDSYRYGYNQERQLFISPLAFKQLLPLLTSVQALLIVNGASRGSLVATDTEPEIQFQLQQAADEVYELAVEGLKDLVILEEYGYALFGNKLYSLEGMAAQRLAQLKKLFRDDIPHQLKLGSAQVRQFIEQALPGLRQVGKLHVQENIANKVVSAPLQAKLYLDRDGDVLTAKPVFHYGDTAIEPLQSGAARRSSGEPDHEPQFIIRDHAGEQFVMRELENRPFEKQQGLLLMQNEDSIYEFLFRSVPRLQHKVEIYTTDSVRALLSKSKGTPRATVEVGSDVNWLEVGFQLEGMDERELRLILRSLIEKKKYHRLSNGAFLSLEEDGFQEIGHMLDGMGVRKSDLTGKSLRLPLVRGFHLLEADEKARNVRLGKKLRNMLDHLKHPDHLEFELPPALDPVLRDYQKYGYQWMKTLGTYGFGGILADDMGLGKTLQSIAYMLSERGASQEPALIVAPASLIYNWNNELKRFAPELKAIVVAGSKQERDDVLETAGTDVDVIITSYPLLRRDLEWYAKRSFRILIMDEAQAFKNHATQTAQAVKELRAGQRFALTGTPVENSLDELWSIFDAVFPDLFASKKSFQNLSREQVARKARPFMLRRLKSEVLKELPEKIETLQPSELSADQKKLYAAYLLQLQKETKVQLESEGFQKSRMKILSGLTRLRQLCCHPALFVENFKGESGKLDQLLELVEECRSGGKRMLIFSQFTSMLQIIRGELDALGVSSFYLDGSTPSAERVELCRRFNEGEQDVFLISLKAGGTGLNLTGADTVVLFDLWWNPAVEQQAADRAHRIGQKNVVQVIRLVAQGTIEEKMYELQQRKKDLINEVVQPGSEALSTLSEQDIRELLMLG